MKTTMEALDFIRALNERPTWAKLLFRLVVGRYAYREFLFMVKNAAEYEPFWDYALEDADYHQVELPWRWWA